MSAAVRDVPGDSFGFVPDDPFKDGCLFIGIHEAEGKKGGDQDDRDRDHDLSIEAPGQ